MRAGQLRHQVTIERPQITRDTAGGEVTTWLPIATVYAGVETLSGREWVTANAAGGELSHRVRMRYFAGLESTDRLTYAGRTFHIEAVLNTDERNVELVVMCREITRGT